MPDPAAAGRLRSALSGLARGERPAFAFAQTVFSQALITVLNLATGMFLARQLGPDGRGVFAAITFWPLAFAMTALAGLPHAQVYRTRGNPTAAGPILGATLLFGAALTLAAIAIGLLLLPLLMGRTYAPETVFAAQLLVAAMTPFVLFSALLKNTFSALKRYRLANIANQADALVYLVLLLAAGVGTTLTPELAAGCMFVGTVIVFGWMALRQRRIAYPQLSGLADEVRPLASFALRAAPNALLANFALSLDRMALVYLVSQADFGLYVVAFGLSRLVLVAQSAVATVGFPAMAGRDPAQTKVVHDRLFRVILYAMFGMTAGGWLVGGMALSLLYGPEFIAATSMFRVLLVGAAITCLCQVPMQLFLCLGRPGFASMVQTASFVALAAALLLLTPMFGSIGAAYAVLAGALVKLAGLLFGIRGALGLPLPALLPNAADFDLLRRGLQRA